MNWLIDTNILIEMEPLPGSDAALRPEGLEFHRLLQTARDRHQYFLHPAAKQDWIRDSNIERKKIRLQLLAKHPILPEPPGPPAGWSQPLAEPGSNNWVDEQLLFTLLGNAVDVLVTNDRDLLSRAALLGLRERVYDLHEAIQYLHRLAGDQSPPPQQVHGCYCHQLDRHDPIFNSFRDDYLGFDDWLEKAKRGHRQAWVIGEADSAIAGFCIWKDENTLPSGQVGKILKLCSFKVSDEYTGQRYGELLLKTAFRHASIGHYDAAYVTVFEKYGLLIDLLKSFGFNIIDARTDLGELQFEKVFTPSANELQELDPLERHIQFGPFHIDWASSSVVIVPIQPQFHDRLFPDANPVGQLFAWPEPVGHAIRKAYICNAGALYIEPGDVLAFYRSQDVKGLTAVGVVEKVEHTSDVEALLRLVRRRTVYTYDELTDLCSREALGILFREAGYVVPAVNYNELCHGGALKAPPQSVTKPTGGAQEWLKSELQDRLQCSPSKRNS